MLKDYSGLPPAGQQHAHSTKPLVGTFTDVNRVYMVFETVIQHACSLFPLQCEPDAKKG